MSKKLYFSAGLLALVSICISPLANAQSLRICDAQASDAEGNGFGWEYDNAIGQWSSCAVTEQSAPAPEVINPETTTPVNLVRAYWDPNADIANRNMRCEHYVFNATTGVYEEGVASGYTLTWGGGRLISSNFNHTPLPSTRPFINSATNPNNDDDGYIPLWGVENGIYEGIAPLALSPYVEIVDTNGGSNNSVRVWHSAIDAENAYPTYHHCFDTEGAAMVPTGAPGVTTANPVARADEIVVSMPPTENGNSTQMYTNLETGQAVVLTEPLWNYNADLAMRRITCNSYLWNGTNYEHDPLNDFRKFDYVFHPRASDDSARVTTVYTDVSLSIYTEDFPIVDGQLQWSAEGFGQVELVNQGIRIWEADTRYRKCTSVKLLGVGNDIDRIWNYPNSYQYGFFESSGYPADTARVDFGPTGEPENITPASECDYSNAALNGGWGWNSNTRESCAPLSDTPSTNECDYSNAALNDGWGWNSSTDESCPPVGIVVSINDCDYSNAALNGGWGWNATTRESCAPIDASDRPTECDYSNAELNGGWGWNSTTSESCAPIDTVPPNSECDYSNANLNNGWGWNNATMSSCPPLAVVTNP